MAAADETKQPSEQSDEELLQALEDSLYLRLRRALEPRIDALLEARAEYFLPEYYDRVVTSEVRRLETAIEHNGRRIDELQKHIDRRFGELKAYVDHRFGEMDRRFEQIDKRFEQIDKRFEQIDKRFEQIDDRLRNIEEQLIELSRQIQATNMRIDRSVRNWVLIGFAFLGTLFTIVQLFLAR